VPEMADPRRNAVEQISNMLSEFRAFGEGLIIVEQSPSKIIRDAIRNTSVKIVHRIVDGNDRRILVDSMGLSGEQYMELLSLKTGEAIVSLEGYPEPIKVVFPKINLPSYRDAEIRNHMKIFYERVRLEPILSPMCWHCREKCVYRGKIEELLKDEKVYGHVREAVNKILWNNDCSTAEKMLQKGAWEAYCAIRKIVQERKMVYLRQEKIAKHLVNIF